MEKNIDGADPCWCGSGTKYADCHLNRAQQDPLERSDFENNGRRNQGAEFCSVNALLKQHCSGKIVRAHTISKSGSLRQIAVDGHVMGTKPRLSEFENNNGRLGLHRVGINQASTFTGFCSHHDKTLFSPLEDQPITLSNEQLFLLAYRSISRELYAKKASRKTADFMKQADRGLGLDQQFLIQNFASLFGGGVDFALDELNHIKSELDEILARKEFSRMNHYIVEFVANPRVLVSSSTQPDFDFRGDRIQNLAQTSQAMSHIIFNCISYDNIGCYVFSWIDIHNSVCMKFVDSLEQMGLQEIGNALIRFSYSYAENTWASPAWWSDLSEEAVFDISERLQHGLLIPITSECLRPNGITFGAYQVARTELRQSEALRPQ
ncbi:SEC-C domain-containing protein [Herbaspirillum huttiense]|uniref:SEC-C domain-containing protein n=1 Tax=Herbaspirillum huttiense TaxID=863372 RepID=UPI00382140CC